MGLAYGLVSQTINPLALWGLPLYVPPPGLPATTMSTGRSGNAAACAPAAAAQSNANRNARAGVVSFMVSSPGLFVDPVDYTSRERATQRDGSETRSEGVSGDNAPGRIAVSVRRVGTA